MFPSRRITMGGDVFRDEHSLRFDGSDDYLETNFIPNYIHTNASMAMWVKMYDFTDSQVLGHHGDKRWYMGFNTTNSFIGVQNANNSSAPITITPTPVVGEWIHYAVTAIDATATVYINGVAQGTLSYTQASAQNPDEGLWCGATNNNGSIYKPMNASISEVVQYNVGLTASQIKTLYNGREPYNHKEGIASANLKNWLRMGDSTLDGPATGAATILGVVGDEVTPTLGAELIQANDVYTSSAGSTDGWTAYANATLTFPGLPPAAVRVTAGTSHGGNGAYVYFRDSVPAIAPDLVVGQLYKFSCNMTTDDSDVNIELSADGVKDSSTGDGYKEMYFIPNGTSNSYVRFDNLSDDKYVELSNISLKKVNGSPGILVNMTASDFEGDAP